VAEDEDLLDEEDLLDDEEWEEERISRADWGPEYLVAPRFAWDSPYMAVLAFGSAFVGLFLTSLYSFLLFHSLAEFYSITVAFTVTILAWNLRIFLSNGFLLFIGVGMAFVAGIDLLHALAYKGMGVFPGYDANLPTQLWIGGRYLEAGLLLVAVLKPAQRYDENLLFVGFAAITTLFLVSIFGWDIFPDCYVEGQGQTAFKVISEYVIVGILGVTLFRLSMIRGTLHDAMFKFLSWAVVTFILSELLFTFYVGVYDLSNLLGHFLKAVSFYLIYKAVVVTGLAHPFSLVFRRMPRD